MTSNKVLLFGHSIVKTPSRGLTDVAIPCNDTSKIPEPERRTRGNESGYINECPIA